MNRRHRYVMAGAVLIAVIVAAATPSVRVPLIHFFGGGEVTEENYRRIRGGMYFAAVDRMLGGKPSLIYEPTPEDPWDYWEWRSPKTGAKIQVAFDNGRAAHKTFQADPKETVLHKFLAPDSE